MYGYTKLLGETATTAPGTPVAVAKTPAGTPVLATKPAAEAALVRSAKTRIAPGIAAGIAGALLWKKHRYLGFAIGSTVGSSAYPIYHKDYSSIVGVATTATGVAGSLYWKKHPFIGFVLGMVGGDIAARYLAPTQFHDWQTGYMK